MTKEHRPSFTPARESATRRQRTTPSPHHRAESSGSDGKTSERKLARNSNNVNWGRRVRAGIAGTAVVAAGVVGVNVLTNEGGEGLAAKEEAQLIDNMHLRDALENGEQVRVNLVPASIQLRPGTVVRDEPPTYIEAGHPDTAARRLDNEQLITRPAIIPGTNTDDITMLMFYPEGSTKLEDAVYVPLTEDNVEHMQFWLSDGVPIDRPLTYADLAYGFEEGIDLNNSIDNLGAKRGADGQISFSFVREGDEIAAMNSAQVSDITAAMAEVGMRPVTVAADTFPQGPTVPLAG